MKIPKKIRSMGGCMDGDGGCMVASDVFIYNPHMHTTRSRQRRRFYHPLHFCYNFSNFKLCSNNYLAIFSIDIILFNNTHNSQQPNNRQPMLNDAEKVHRSPPFLRHACRLLAVPIFWSLLVHPISTHSTHPASPRACACVIQYRAIVCVCVCNSKNKYSTVQ